MKTLLVVTFSLVSFASSAKQAIESFTLSPPLLNSKSESECVNEKGVKTISASLITKVTPSTKTIPLFDPRKKKYVPQTVTVTAVSSRHTENGKWVRDVERYPWQVFTQCTLSKNTEQAHRTTAWFKGNPNLALKDFYVGQRFDYVYMENFVPTAKELAPHSIRWADSIEVTNTEELKWNGEKVHVFVIQNIRSNPPPGKYPSETIVSYYSPRHKAVLESVWKSPTVGKQITCTLLPPKKK